MAQRADPADPPAIARFGGSITRRSLFARGAGAGMAVMTARAGPAAILPGEHGPRPALFLVERGIPGAAALARAMAEASVRIVEFDNDMGGPWMEAVQPLWRRALVPIAGLTGEGARFCIEQLGRSAGLACTFRRAYRAADAAAIVSQLVRPAPTAGFAPLHGISGPSSAWLLQPVGRRT